MYIRLLAASGLAKVKRLAPVPQFIVAKPLADLQTLQAVIANRYHVLASYAASLRRLHVEDLVALQAMQAMRRELVALWDRSMATREQLVGRLQNWCQRAEASGIAPLAEFSRRLRCYA
jgi:stearoyl-CoA desaturase (delta-9 desaturase)